MKKIFFVKNKSYFIDIIFIIYEINIIVAIAFDAIYIYRLNTVMILNKKFYSLY